MGAEEKGERRRKMARVTPINVNQTRNAHNEGGGQVV